VTAAWTTLSSTSLNLHERYGAVAVSTPSWVANPDWRGHRFTSARRLGGWRCAGGITDSPCLGALAGVLQMHVDSAMVATTNGAGLPLGSVGPPARYYKFTPPRMHFDSAGGHRHGRRWFFKSPFPGRAASVARVSAARHQSAGRPRPSGCHRYPRNTPVGLLSVGGRLWFWS
jgi:hypothetical protein